MTRFQGPLLHLSPHVCISSSGGKTVVTLPKKSGLGDLDHHHHQKRVTPQNDDQIIIDF
jgi:hypothetical protein